MDPLIFHPLVMLAACALCLLAGAALDRWWVRMTEGRRNARAWREVAKLHHTGRIADRRRSTRLF